MPQEKPEAPEETFTIDARVRQGGKTVTVTLVLPKFEDVITFGHGRRLRDQPQELQLYLALEDRLSEDELAQIDQLSVRESKRVFQAWQEDSEVTLGESGASST